MIFILVLPAFNVTVTPTKSFISLDDSELVVEITARSDQFKQTYLDETVLLCSFLMYISSTSD